MDQVSWHEPRKPLEQAWFSRCPPAIALKSLSLNSQRSYHPGMPPKVEGTAWLCTLKPVQMNAWRLEENELPGCCHYAWQRTGRTGLNAAHKTLDVVATVGSTLHWFKILVWSKVHSWSGARVVNGEFPVCKLICVEVKKGWSMVSGMFCEVEDTTLLWTLKTMQMYAPRPEEIELPGSCQCALTQYCFECRT